VATSTPAGHLNLTLARDSSGLLPDPGRAWRLEWLTNFLLTNWQYQAQLDKRVEGLLEQREDYELIVKVPYSGPNALGTILAVTSDVARFSNYRKYVAYGGYFAGLDKSQTIDRTRMSRRGNRDIKRALFQIAAPLVWFDKGVNPYKTLFQDKTDAGREWYKAIHQLLPLWWMRDSTAPWRATGHQASEARRKGAKPQAARGDASSRWLWATQVKVQA